MGIILNELKDKLLCYCNKSKRSFPTGDSYQCNPFKINRHQAQTPFHSSLPPYKPQEWPMPIAELDVTRKFD